MEGKGKKLAYERAVDVTFTFVDMGMDAECIFVGLF